VKGFSSSILMRLPFRRGSFVVNPLETLFNSTEKRMDTTPLISQYLRGRPTQPPWIRISPLRQRPTRPHRHSVLADSGILRPILLHLEALWVRPCLRLIHLCAIPETSSTQHLLALVERALLTLISSRGLMFVPVFPIMFLVERLP